MKTSIAIVAVILGACGASACAQELWVGKDGSIRNPDARAMTMGRGEALLATRSEVYRASAGKEAWESVFALPPGENEITCLADGARGIYIGTARGLYASNDGGRTWRNLFKTVISEKSHILSIALPASGADTVVLGTGRGVFISDDSGLRWRDISGALKNKRVFFVLRVPRAIYASSDQGVFVRPDDKQAWERIYIKTSSAETEAKDDDAGSYGMEEAEGAVTAPLAISGSRLYAAMDRKICVSDDAGRSWQAVPAEGLAGSVNFLLPSPDGTRLYCATTRGVFEYDPGKKVWAELYRGFDKPVDVRSVHFDRENEKALWAVTGRGVYRFESGRFAEGQFVDIERGIEGMRVIYDGEPAFRQLQRAAMKFAEVEPEKISNWRAQARLRALIPTINVGIDNNVSNTYEIYTSATKDYIVSGPDDNSKGFDVSVSWDLGDIIFSADQTNIDVRSRLTTQLRNDILDDLRRVYYERKRLQFELLTSPPKDMKMRFEKEMRVKELTQAIDDLTGNYLSDHMARPEPEALQK